MGGPDSKISTVDVESGDNMATLPVSRAHTSSTDTAEKNNAANKEMELKNVCPKPLERYGQFYLNHSSTQTTFKNQFDRAHLHIYWFDSIWFKLLFSVSPSWNKATLRIYRLIFSYIVVFCFVPFWNHCICLFLSASIEQICVRFVQLLVCLGYPQFYNFTIIHKTVMIMIMSSSFLYTNII